MALVLATLSARVKVDGKDSSNQFSTQREQYIKDTLREMTMSLDWRFLKKPTTLSLASGWISLPSDFKKMLAVMYNNEPLVMLQEEDYFQHAYRFDGNHTEQERTAYYRLKYDAASSLWQISFLNMPTTGTVDYLYQAFTDDVTTVPAMFEEPIVLGATAKFLRLMEGDDMTVADKYEQQFRTQTEQLFSYMDVDRYSNEPDRVKTNAEIEAEYNYRSVL